MFPRSRCTARRAVGECCRRWGSEGKMGSRARSSVGQSSRLIIGRSQVRVLPGPLTSESSSRRTVAGASSRRTPLSVGRCRARRRTLARAQCLGAERLDARSGRPDSMRAEDNSWRKSPWALLYQRIVSARRSGQSPDTIPGESHTERYIREELYQHARTRVYLRPGRERTPPLHH